MWSSLGRVEIQRYVEGTDASAKNHNTVDLLITASSTVDAVLESYHCEVRHSVDGEKNSMRIFLDAETCRRCEVFGSLSRRGANA